MSHMEPPTPSPAAGTAAAPGRETGHNGPPRYRARDLSRGGDLVTIEHDGQVYTLRITRSNKLILTK
ncbi:MAG: hemin uptake protein HemP [Pseudomonadota bacterium]